MAGPKENPKTEPLTPEQLTEKFLQLEEQHKQLAEAHGETLKKAEGLEKANKDLSKDLADAKAANAKSQKDFEIAMGVVSEAHDKLSKQQKQLAGELKKVKVETPAAGAEKKAAPKKLEKVVTPDKPFSLGGTNYLFKSPRVRDLNGNVVLTKAIVESPGEYEGLLQHLVNTKSGLIKAVIE